MADPRFSTDPVATTNRLIVAEVHREFFDTSTLRREAMRDTLFEAGGVRPVSNVAQRARVLLQEQLYANPLLI